MLAVFMAQHLSMEHCEGLELAGLVQFGGFRRVRTGGSSMPTTEPCVCNSGTNTVQFGCTIARDGNVNCDEQDVEACETTFCEGGQAATWTILSVPVPTAPM